MGALEAVDRLNRKALALIIVAGVLGVMTVLGVCFVVLARMERQASQRRTYATKALLLARSGLEDALARLAAGQECHASINAYGGEDWNDDRILNAGVETDGQIYQPSKLNRNDCPTTQALRPSFCKLIGLNPDLVLMDGRMRGYTGRLADDSSMKGNTYTLNARAGDGLFLNGGDPASEANLGYNAVLRRILGTLAEAVDREDGVAGNGPVTQADGLNLIDRRPRTARGWESWKQVRDLALSGSQAKLDALQSYLTLQAWVDRKVISPNAMLGMEGRNCQSWAYIKLTHETYSALPGTKEPGFERIPLLPGGKLVGRAPIGLDWARTRRPILIALLAGLKGLTLDQTTAIGSTGDHVGTLRTTEISLDWSLTSDDCRHVADYILNSTSELKTWEQWHVFCDAIPDALISGSAELRQSKRDLLKANFNPNSRLNKFCPNASLWTSVDKSDLLVYSTEFSLLPSTASAQELESVARILGKNGRVLASRALKASIAPVNHLTLSTQKEFVCEELGDVSVAGDEWAFRQPGQTSFMSGSAGTGKTWGHALGGLGTTGTSLQTYPEPIVITESGATLAVRPANYDGTLQLATVETAQDDWYGVDVNPSPPVKDMKLLARYTTGLDLDVSDAAPDRPDGDARWRNLPDIQQVTYNGGGSPTLSELGNGLLHPTRPNTLYPDGIYSEKDRAPSYLDQNNANGFHGLITYWLKPNCIPLSGQWGAYLNRLHPYFMWTNFREAIRGGDLLSPNQFFYLGDEFCSRCGAAIVCLFEVGHELHDTRQEHRFIRGGSLPPHQWHLVTVSYDFQSPDKDDCSDLRVNAGLAINDHWGLIDQYNSFGNDPSQAADITLDDIFGPHRLILGKGWPEGQPPSTGPLGTGADATFDELAIYDFGGATYTAGVSTPATPATLATPGVLAAHRFKEGRYYKESTYPTSGGLLTALGALRNAGEYFSPLIRLGPCRIQALTWTQVVPRGLKAPLPAEGQAGVDGDPGDDGRIILELTNASGGDYLQDTAGRRVSSVFHNPASSPVDRTLNASFRLHAIFQPNLADKANTPILDPLALDDITVIYEPLGGRRILVWGE